MQIFCLLHEISKTERLSVRPALGKRLKHVKGNSTKTPEVTAQVENKSLPTAQQHGPQLIKHLFPQIVKVKAAECCWAALYTYVLKTR